MKEEAAQTMEIGGLTIGITPTLETPVATEEDEATTQTAETEDTTGDDDAPLGSRPRRNSQFRSWGFSAIWKSAPQILDTL
jgi:hypothetical protein